MGQLLVVLYITPQFAGVFVQWTSRTDPWSIVRFGVQMCTPSMDLGSELVLGRLDISGLDHRSRSRSRDGKVRLQTEILAYEPLVLIPEPLCPRDRSRDGSGIRILIEQSAQAWNLQLIQQIKCRGMVGTRGCRLSPILNFQGTSNMRKGHKPQA